MSELLFPLQLQSLLSGVASLDELAGNLKTQALTVEHNRRRIGLVVGKITPREGETLAENKAQLLRRTFEVGQMLESEGIDVFSSALIPDTLEGRFPPAEFYTVFEDFVRSYVRVLITTEGWEQSSGARSELSLARIYNLDIYHFHHELLERELPEKLSTDEFYNALCSVLDKIPDRRAFIHDELLPFMDVHRDREKPASEFEILQKLFSVDENKPGELVELMFESMKNGFQLTTDRALEIADVIYYMEQPGGRKWLYGDAPFEFNHSPEMLEVVERALGVTLDEARLFCIVKYFTRVHYSRLAKEDRKVRESEIMTRFLKRKIVK